MASTSGIEVAPATLAETLGYPCPAVGEAATDVVAVEEAPDEEIPLGQSQENSLRDLSSQWRSKSDSRRRSRHAHGSRSE